MRILRRKMLRDVWQIRWRALAVTLTVAAGVGIYAGIGMAIISGFHTRDVLFQRMRFADLEVQFLPEDVANIPDLSRVPGVRGLERRLILPGAVLLAGDTRISGTIVFLETAEPTLDALELIEGGPVRPHDFESAVIERSLATFHGVRVGDRVRVQVGEKLYESRVDGVALSPEYLITTANPEYLVPEKGSVGVVFTSLERVSDALGFTMVNDLLLRFEPGADPRTVRDAVMARLGRLNLERVIPKTQHFIWRFLQLELEAFQVYAPSIVLTLGVLSFVLTLITVNRLVLEQRTEIGALLALGYGRGQVLRAYLTVGLLLGAAGGLIGMGLGFVFRDLFARTYARGIGMPEIITVVAPGVLATGLVAAVLGTVAASAVPVWRLLRLPPQAIIRDLARDGVGAGRWMRRVFASMAILPLPVRFGVRNMLRRPGRTVSTIVAIGFSLGVSIAYVMSVTSALQTTELVFAREGWDLAVDFLYPVALEEVKPIRSLPGVAKVEPYFRRFAELGIGDRYESAGILGIHPDSGMKRTLVKAGRFLSGRPDELIVSQDLARRLGVRVGAHVTVRIRSGRDLPFRVVGISGEIIPAQIMMSFRQAQAITDFEDTATGVYVATSGPAPGLPASLAGLEYVAKVTSKAGVAAAFRKLTAALLDLVYLASGVGVVVAMLFIVMSVNFAISERQVEYATFKCLGYGGGRLATTILAQAFGEGGLAALVSIPVGIGLAMYLNARMSEARHEVISTFHAGDVARVLVTAFTLIPLAAAPGLRMLNQLNLARVLGTRSIE